MKKVLSAIGIAALAATAFVATPAQAATKLKIAHIPKLGTIGYFQAAHKGVERACKELKATCAYKGPTEITAAAQVKEINAAVQGGYNVLIVAANDKDALVPALKAAMKKKVTVVTYDSDVAQAGRSVFVNQASSEGIGQALAKSASDLAGGKGDIAILSTTPDATNQNVWIDYMKKELAAKYPDVKVVATAYGLDKPEESTTETQGLIQKYPTIKAIVAPTSLKFIGMDLISAAQLVNKDVADFYLDFIIDEELKASCVIFAGHEPNVRAIMQDKRHMVGSDGILTGNRPHPRGYGTFARYLGVYAREEKVLTLHGAIARMTGRAAKRLGLSDRGFIKKGMKADLVLFDAESVIDRSTYEAPRVVAAGIEMVWISGIATLKNGQRTQATPGVGLRR